jgi:CBS domain-containing protein
VCAFEESISENAAFGGEEESMTTLHAKDIMHPRLSLSVKDQGHDVVKKLLVGYPALPVVNEDLEVVGIVSEHEILSALVEKRTVHEFSAESLMGCGHAEHGACKEPLTISDRASIDDVVRTFTNERVSILPVVNDRKKLIGIISKKNIIMAMAEKGF